MAGYVRLGGGLWYDNNSTGGVTFNCLKDVSSSSARLFDVVYAALLQQGPGSQLPYDGDVDSYLQHCASSGFPSVQVMLSRLGCTEQPAAGAGSPTFSRPTAVLVQAMKDEYLGNHPYYKS